MSTIDPIVAVTVTTTDIDPVFEFTILAASGCSCYVENLIPALELLIG